MSRRKIIAGSILLVVVTFVLTSGMFLYLLNSKTGDVTSTFKFFRAMQVVKSRYVEDIPYDTLMAGAIK